MSVCAREKNSRVIGREQREREDNGFNSRLSRQATPAYARILLLLVVSTIQKYIFWKQSN